MQQRDALALEVQVNRESSWATDFMLFSAHMGRLIEIQPFGLCLTFNLVAHLLDELSSW